MSLPQRSTTPWGLRSRTVRKLAVIRLKNEIRANKPQLGGLFTTHDVIDLNSWADIEFLSRVDRLRLYNATIDTALYSYAGRCEELAWAHSEKILPLHERQPEMFKDLLVKDPATGHHTLADSKPAKIEREMRAFGGLRLYDWIEMEAARIADSGDVWVSPAARIDPSYRYGVGLMATVAHDALTIANLDAFVADFLSRGEKPYAIDSIKLSFPSSRLKESRSANAIGVDPKDWATPLERASAAQAALAREEREALEASSNPVPAARKPRSL